MSYASSVSKSSLLVAETRLRPCGTARSRSRTLAYAKRLRNRAERRKARRDVLET